MILNIYTDGSRDNNHKCGGWAYLLFTESNKAEAKGFDLHTTINAMELRAIYEALSYVQAVILGKGYPIEVIYLHTDSQYCAEYLNPSKSDQLLESGIFSSKSKLKNKIVLENTIKLIRELPCKLTICKDTSHSNNRYNEYVNNLAISAMREGEAKYFKKFNLM